MERAELIKLVTAYLDSSIAADDLILLKKYVEKEESDPMLLDIWDECYQAVKAHPLTKDKANQLFDQILIDPRVQPQLQPQKQKSWNPLLLKMAAAACVLLLLKIGLDIATKKSLFQNATVVNHKNQSKIVPGSNKGKILLEDGRVVNLESIKKDTTIHFKHFSIHKTADGSITYSVNASGLENKVVYNTIITPKGGEYKLVLADGTDVWINASSQLKYPINFGNKTREVELIGEAYFDVKKSQVNGKHIPFIVKTGKQKLEVLGTSFNINSYGNQIATTLVNGLVKLSYADHKEYFLKPNHQAVYEKDNSNVKIAEVETFYITAWKNGSFAFNNATIYEVMEMISRWYDVEIVYASDLSGIKFTGTVSRFEEIEKLLKTIAMTGSVTFSINERRVTVKK